MSSVCTTTTCYCDPYNNCGCLNPTSFECVDTPGECEATGITADMNGLQALSQICETIEDIQSKEGKVLIDSNDTCPEYLWDKLEEGLNISFTQTGTGCDKKLVINAVEGGEAIDEHVKVSADDTTTGYLDAKLTTGSYITKTVNNPAGNENLEIDVDPVQLISADSGNQLTIGTDGGLKTAYSAPDGSETKVIEGAGVTVSGTGTTIDPYIIATNPSIQATRTCFDGVWRTITLVASGNGNVVYASGAPEFRYRFDGTLEFRGAITYNVTFGSYSTSNRKYTIPMGNIPSTCLSLGELAGTVDLKGITYIDIPGTGDQITQQYGYVVRKSTQNFILEFQSAYIAASTVKTIVVNLEGCQSHPSL